MKLRLISCEVLEREAEFCLLESSHLIDVEYTEKEAHEKPDQLRERIQRLIDASDGYDAVLLGYGLCGNALNGISANNCRLIVPRAHDCCTLFLGSRQRFNEVFDGRESMPWGSTGYCAKGEGYLRKTDTGSMMGYDKTYEDFVRQYGEENAAFIWETIHPESDSDEVLFINVPETYDMEIYSRFAKEAGDDKIVTVEEGSISIIRKLLSGQWDDDFLVVEAGDSVKAVYDKERIICSSLA